MTNKSIFLTGFQPDPNFHLFRPFRVFVKRYVRCSQSRALPIPVICHFFPLFFHSLPEFIAKTFHFLGPFLFFFICMCMCVCMHVLMYYVCALNSMYVCYLFIYLIIYLFIYLFIILFRSFKNLLNSRL